MYLSTSVSVGCVPGVIVQVCVEDDENQGCFIWLGVGLVVVAVVAALWELGEGLWGQDVSPTALSQEIRVKRRVVWNVKKTLQRSRKISSNRKTHVWNNLFYLGVYRRVALSSTTFIAPPGYPKSTPCPTRQLMDLGSRSGASKNCFCVESNL